MNTDEMIERAVQKVLSVWALGIVAAIIWVLVYASPWWLFAIAGVAFVSFYGILYTTGFYFAWKMSRGLIPSMRPPTPVATPIPDNLGTVMHKGPVIGRYRDNDIYDWIEVVTSKGIERFDFLGGLQRDRGGNPMLPNEDGYAVIEEGIYVLQPELSAEKAT